MEKLCKKCSIILDEKSKVKNGIRNGIQRFNSVCRQCHSSKVQKSMKGNPKRQAYMRAYIRRRGWVKEYPCLACNKPCYKKYALAFCSDECRFFHYVEKTDTCWLWTGSKNRRGYGKLSFRGNQHATAHRASYVLFKGEIPDGKLVCHNCPGGDRPSCVNPQHLWIGTTQQNSSDSVQKGTSLRGEKHNKAKITQENILKIREMGDLGIVQWKIGEMFNLTSGHVNNIIKRRVWKHI